MEYHTFPPQPDLSAIVDCYWTLEVPADPSPQKQRIIPDGTIEMAFILGDDIKRYTQGDHFIVQPRAMVLGQTMEPFYIEPTGYVHSFAIRFFPYGFANFVSVPIKSLVNKETPLAELFPTAVAEKLSQQIVEAEDTSARIAIIEQFLLDQLTTPATVDLIVQDTIAALISSNGNSALSDPLKNNASKKKQLQRKFVQQIGISPKQLGKVIRLQSALKMMLHQEDKRLTHIAYQNNYYDQAHFIKDFKEFTGTNPSAFLTDDHLALSALFYTE